MQRIGPYRLLKVLGAGGMAVIYLGEHERTGRRAAIKTVGSPDERHLFGLRREIRALAQLRHPGIVRVLEHGVDDSVPWYAMEVFDGKTLADQLADTWRNKRRRFDVNASTQPARLRIAVAPEIGGAGADTPDVAAPAVSTVAVEGELRSVLETLCELCVALAFLHGEGIVHRDLKPHNVLLGRDGAPVLLDFGLAVRSAGSVGREILDVTVPEGTAAYMAPEQIQGSFVDARADLYAVGCLLYEAVTGNPPFSGPSLREVLSMHLLREPRRPSEIVGGVPPRLEQLILRLLQKQPRRRPGHADDVVQALTALGAPPRRQSAPRRTRAYVYRPELVGRHAALEQLAACLERAQQGRGGLALIRGESGIGKTYLAMNLGSKAAERGFQVITGACVPITGSTIGDARPDDAPAGTANLVHERLHPFQPFLQAVVDRCLAKGHEGVADLLGDRGPVLAACAPRIGELPALWDLPPPPELSANAAYERLLRALADTVFALSAQVRLLFILDDLQWADEASLDLLALLAADPRLAERHVLLVGTYRAEETTPALRALADRAGVCRVDLDRLDEASVGAMVGDMLALESPPAPFVAFLSRQSAGNPFFVSEYLRLAVSEGLLRRDAEGRWALAESEQGDRAYERLPLPGSLRGLIVHHLDLLSAEARQLALCASVLGREVDVDLLSAVAALEEPAFLDAVAELSLRQLLDEPAPGRLRFLHDKLREVAYALIPAETQRILHRRAAYAIESRHAGSAELRRFYPQLAHHFTRAGETLKALEYLEKAAADALAHFENRKAAAFLADLLALGRRTLLGPHAAHAGGDPASIAGLLRRGRLSARDQLSLVRWESQMAAAYHGLGDLLAASRHASLALAWSARRPPEDASAQALSLLREIVIQTAHRLLPRAVWRTRGELEQEMDREISRANLLLQGCAFFNGTVLSLCDTALAGMNHAEAAGTSTGLAMNYAGAGIFLGSIRLGGLAERYFARARATAEQDQDRSARAYVYWAEMMNFLWEGKWEEMRARGALAAQIAEGTGDRHVLERVLLFSTIMGFQTGDIEGGLDSSDRLARSADERGDVLHYGLGTMCSAMYLTLLGRFEESRARLECAQASQSCARYDFLRIQHLAAQAFFLNRSGRTEEAVPLVEQMLSLITGGQLRLLVYFGYAAAADVLLSRWEAAPLDRPLEAASAGRAARRAVGGLLSCALQLNSAWPLYYAVRARQLRLSGATSRAARVAWRALSAARKAQTRYFEAMALRELGLLAPAGSAARRERLDEAEALFVQIGCRPDADLCRKLRGA